MWRVIFTNDTDNEKVGTLRATWVDQEKGEYLVVSDRFDDESGLDIGKFKELCQVTLAQYREKNQKQNEIALKVEGELNG